MNGAWGLLRANGRVSLSDWTDEALELRSSPLKTRGNGFW
jgi:hypothetical protein